MSNAIYVDLDYADIDRLVKQFGATERDYYRAFNRALRRTARSLGKQARIGVRRELELRNAKIIRRRLQQTFRMKAGKGGAVRLWFGPTISR